MENEVASSAGPLAVRLMGDPVLRRHAAEVTEINGCVARTATNMVLTMYQAGGIGLAAPQVGIQQRFLVYDLQGGAGPQALINPEVIETDGEWAFAEACLSMPGLSFEIVRPKQIHLVGRGLDGNEVSIEADELLARLLQHELDHLDGVLAIDHLDREERKAALRTWSELTANPTSIRP